jgi:hypothetical protein
MKLGEAMYKAQQAGGGRRSGGDAGGGDAGGRRRTWSTPTSRKSTTTRRSRPERPGEDPEPAREIARGAGPVHGVTRAGAKVTSDGSKAVFAAILRRGPVRAPSAHSEAAGGCRMSWQTLLLRNLWASARTGDASRELKAAFRKLAMQHHPDRNPGDNDGESSSRKSTRPTTS